MSTERVIVHKRIADQLISAVKDLCSGLKAGDVVNDSSVKLGSLFAESSADNVIGMIQDASKNGAEVILGDAARHKGVLQPHLVLGVKPGMRLWDRETFGPVVVFATVESTDEAVELANASEYSLSASLWTSDLYAAQTIASRIRSGMAHGLPFFLNFLIVLSRDHQHQRPHHSR